MPSSLQMRLLRGYGLKGFAAITLRSLSFRFRMVLEHSTPKKLANMVAVKAQKWLKTSRVLGMPYHYVIDATNACNLRCRVCPTGLGTLGRARGIISLDRFKKIIDEIAPYAYEVWLFNWGEAFLHPRIFDIIEYASSRRIAVRISSNLNRFSKEMAEKVVQSGLDNLLISVDGATQEVYERYRKGGRLDTVLQNIRHIVAAKRALHRSKPYIYMRMLVNRYNENQIDEMVRIVTEVGVDAFRIGAMYVDTTDPEQVKEWLPENETLSVYDYSAEKMTNVYHCADLWQSMTINWDGGVAPCCWVHEQKNDFANVFNSSVRQVWNSSAYTSSRGVFAFGGPKENAVETICTRCKGRPMYLKD